MKRALRWYDFFTINVYWLGIFTMINTVTPLVAPLLVQRFVGEELKGTYYGSLRLWTLMVALLMQALMGMLSDRSIHPMGRRRPFIFIATLADAVILILIGFSASLEGMTGYWILFALVILLMAASNTGHGPLQGLIPDLVPLEKRGIYSSIKSIFEVPLPLILVSFTIGRWISRGHLWASMIGVIVVLFVTLLITMFAPEEKQEKLPQPIDWKPFLRLILMTAAFTIIILGAGQLTRWAAARFDGSSVVRLVVRTGLVGLAAMIAAIVLGVWMSISLGVGKEARQRPSFIWWVVNRLAFLVGANNLASFVVYFLQARMGYVREAAAAPAATLTMFVGIFILVSALPSGWLADRFGRKTLVGISGLAAAAGTALAVAVPSLPVIYAGGCLIGAGCGLFYTANWALGTEIVPKDQAGRFLGLSNVAGAGAGAIGAYIGGPIADFISSRAPGIPGLGYLVLFTIYGALFLLSTLALWGIQDKKIGNLS